ncbi:MAG: PEP-CTERM sorting domain-containing protein [Sedimentisphaerales bacterium]|nr:PEP-CTERM sorting domain-containing protein [Sedimentisphaerales bacterium]
MKKTAIILTAALGFWAAQAGAITVNTYEFVPSPFNLEDLDHHYYYAWGIQSNIPGTEVIESALLEIYQINNWYEPWETDDVLHIWMLDQKPTLSWQYSNWPGVSRGYDNQNHSDPFATSGGTFLMNFTDDNAYYNHGWKNPAEDISIALPVDTLTNYINNDSLFGFGFDPDCHYWNCGIKLTITTRPGGGGGGVVPEPVTMLGSILSLGSLGGYLARRKKSA